VHTDAKKEQRSTNGIYVLSLEAISQVLKTEEQLAKEKKQIDHANDAVEAANSASEVAEIEAERKVPEEVETARVLVEREKIRFERVQRSV